MRGRVRLGVGILLAVIALNVVLALVSSATGGRPGGPRSSSYATGATGLAAYSDLLERGGHPVARLRGALADARLDPRTTLVVLDPRDLPRGDQRALRGFVARGGRLVAGGRDPGWLGGVVQHVPSWRPDGVVAAHPLLPVPETAGVTAVRAAGEGAWRAEGSPLPAVGSGGRALVTVVRQGAGRIVLLADPSPLQNRLLGAADDAALGLALAGERGRRVTFAEGVHGYGRATGLAALPWRWRLFLGGLLLAALAWVASRARRLGPPEDEARALPPPRRAYVDALAASLARADAAEDTAERVRLAARARVAQRAGLGAQPDVEAVAGAGERLGLDPDELAALRGEGDLLAAGRALAASGRRAP